MSEGRDFFPRVEDVRWMKVLFLSVINEDVRRDGREASGRKKRRERAVEKHFISQQWNNKIMKLKYAAINCVCHC